MDPYQTQSATLGQVFDAFHDIFFSTDPVIQLFVMAFGILVGIPFVGGMCIIVYEWTKDPVQKPKRAFSWVPFIGTALFYYKFPLDFFQFQSKKRGAYFTVDTIKNEFLYCLDQKVNLLM